MALVFRKDENKHTVSTPLKPTSTLVYSLEKPVTEEYFRSVQTVKIDADGSVTPNIIDLGYQGDGNITKIIFDVSELKWHNSTSRNYNIALTFFDSKAPLTENNPMIYDVDIDNTFVVPQELTLSATAYQVILSIRENSFDDVSGNIDNPPNDEIFISSVFNARCLANSLAPMITDDYFFESAEESYQEHEELIALVKNKLELSISNNQLAIDTNIFGNKMDKYIKYIKLKGLPTNTDLDSGWYILFNNSSIYKLIKIKSALDIIWIPQEFTMQAGNVSVTLIGYNSKKEKTLCFNTVSGQIVDNFLQSSEWLIPNRGGNLVSADNYYLISSDGLTITSAEG